MKHKHIFIADLRWGKPNLTKFKVLKETKKLFKLGTESVILGRGIWARQIHKDDVTCFENPIDAVAYLIAEQDKYIKHTQKKLNEASGSLVTLKSLLRELEEKK